MINKIMISKIKVWLKKPGNTTEGLADELGYSSGSAIRHWINRGRIPAHMVFHVEKVVGYVGSRKRK